MMNTTESVKINEEKALPKGSVVILRTLVGSTIHGVNVQAQDDRDEMGVVIEPIDHVIGLQHWETAIERTKPEGVRSGPGDLDLTFHSLRKFCRLASKGNPSILLLLFVPDSGVVQTSELGERLRDQRSMFLSQNCGAAFLGYMQAQRERLSGERGSRHGKPRQELIDQYGFDTKYAGHIVRLGFQGVELATFGTVTLPMREEERQYIVDIRTGKIPLNEVLKKAGTLERALRDAIDTGCLPKHPQYKIIDDFLQAAYLRTWLSNTPNAFI